MSEWQRWKNIMKCVPFEEKRLLKWQPPFVVQPKFDGDRCRCYPLNSGEDHLLVSSEENPFFSVPHIIEELKQFKINQLIDGELYSHELMLEGGHELIHSLASRTVNLHERHKELQLHIFDIESEKPQWERLKLLKEMSNAHQFKYIKFSPFWICNDLTEIKKTYDFLIKAGYEGIIIRHFLTPYERKRSTQVMKFKPKQKDDYQIIGFNEEVDKTGMPKGRLGSLILTSQKNDVFSVSAGLNSDEREFYWKVKNQLIGLTATVHYQHLTDKGIPKGCFDLEIQGLKLA